MIFRLLLLFLIVWFLIWIFKKQFSVKHDSKPSLKDSQSEDMLACYYCGMYVPKSLAFRSGNKFYCNPQHANLDKPNNNEPEQ